MNLNQATILGRVTRDPEIKVLPSGVKVATFSMATNKYWKDQQGQKQESTEFHNVVFFGNVVDTIGSYVRKGSLLLVQGRLQTRSWEDKDTGKKMYRTEIVGDLVQLPPKALSGNSSQSSSPEYSQPAPQDTGAQPAYPEDEINVEDIPF